MGWKKAPLNFCRAVAGGGSVNALLGWFPNLEGLCGHYFVSVSCCPSSFFR